MQLIPYGVVVEFDAAEAAHLANNVNAGAAAASGLSTILGGFGITAAGAVVAGIVSALLWVGAAGLSNCNAQGKGIYLFVLWYGATWCKSRP